MELREFSGHTREIRAQMRIVNVESVKCFGREQMCALRHAMGAFVWQPDIHILGCPSTRISYSCIHSKLTPHSHTPVHTSLLSLFESRTVTVVILRYQAIITLFYLEREPFSRWRVSLPNSVPNFADVLSLIGVKSYDGYNLHNVSTWLNWPTLSLWD